MYRFPLDNTHNHKHDINFKTNAFMTRNELYVSYVGQY